MTRRAQIVIVTVFACVLVVPGLMMLIGVRPENLENRRVTAFPEVGASSLIDDAFYRDLTVALTDRLPLRDRAIRANNSMEDALSLNEALDPELPRGSDGWLYYHETLVDECVGPPPKVFLEHGDEVARVARRADIPFAYFVAPDKVSIYPEHLPVEGLAGFLDLGEPEPPACNRSWDEALAEAAPDHRWLEPLADDLRADRAATGERLFFKLDTHWSDAGSLNQVEAMVEFLRPGLWDPDAVKPTVPDVKGAPDSSVLRGESDTEEAPGYLVERDGVTFEYERATIGQEGSAVDVARSTSTGPEVIEGTTVLVGDSFSRHTIELMAPYFENLVWLSREYLKSHKDGLDTVLQGEVPTAVLVEQVQRNVTKGWHADFLKPLERYFRQQAQ